MSMRSRRLNRRLFAHCVASELGAFVMFPELDRLCPAKFASMRRNSLEFQLPAENIPGINDASVCCITFENGSIQHAFLTLISIYRKLSHFDPARLTVAQPRHVYGEQRRSATRVAVPAKSGLVVRVAADGGYLWAPRAVNVSVTGILLNFGELDPPNLPVGMRLDVVMVLGVDTATINAEILRRNRHEYALRFRDVHEAAALAPPIGLLRIIKKLELQCRQQRYCSESNADGLENHLSGDTTAVVAAPACTATADAVDAASIQSTLEC